MHSQFYSSGEHIASTRYQHASALGGIIMNLRLHIYPSMSFTFPFRDVRYFSHLQRNIEIWIFSYFGIFSYLLFCGQSAGCFFPVGYMFVYCILLLYVIVWDCRPKRRVNRRYGTISPPVLRWLFAFISTAVSGLNIHVPGIHYVRIVPYPRRRVVKSMNW